MICKVITKEENNNNEEKKDVGVTELMVQPQSHL